jgi:prevent-host-death family protein
MKTLTAKDAKYRFGNLIDLARAEPVVIAKHGRPVVVVLAVEEFEQLKASATKPGSGRWPTRCAAAWTRRVQAQSSWA